MSDNLLKDLKFLIPDLRTDVELAPYTTWKIGGSARFFWEPCEDKLPEVLDFCTRNGIRTWHLGRGSNTLISSHGLDGLVICTKKAMQNIEHRNGVITAEAGVPMPALSKFAANMGWGGYEYLIGIPGTVGAGIAINAGLTAHGRKEIGDVLIDVELMDRQGGVWKETAGELELGYRTSNIPERDLFVLKAKFKATYKATKEEIKYNTANHLAERRRKQPLSKATAGSTFKQPPGGKPAGLYIDQAGLKGFQVGGIKVSEIHANWLENVGAASSEDVFKIVEEIKEKVYQKFEIELLNEFQYLN